MQITINNNKSCSVCKFPGACRSTGRCFKTMAMSKGVHAAKPAHTSVRRAATA